MAYQRICQYVNEHGISFASIAKKAGIEYQTFISMMNGNQRLTADEYVAICSALGVSIDFFYCSPASA